MAAAAILRFPSADGTPIACAVTGDGPPLLLVHGVTATRERWDGVRDRLGAAFTVYTMDRRGRGDSGDTEPYALDREAEDVAAVARALGGGVAVAGHSFGGLIALEAAMRSPDIVRVVAYEGFDEPFPEEQIAAMDALVARGDREGAVAYLLGVMAGIPTETLDVLRSLPSWRHRIAAAHTAPRELRAINAYGFDPSRYAALRRPALLLVGGESDAQQAKLAHRAAAAMPDARVVVLPGQGHAAMDTGPEIFTAAVAGFLTA